MNPLLSKKILEFESVMEANLADSEDSSCREGALIMTISKTDPRDPGVQSLGQVFNRSEMILQFELILTIAFSFNFKLA